MHQFISCSNKTQSPRICKFLIELQDTKQHYFRYEVFTAVKWPTIPYSPSLFHPFLTPFFFLLFPSVPSCSLSFFFFAAPFLLFPFSGPFPSTLPKPPFIFPSLGPVQGTSLHAFYWLALNALYTYPSSYLPTSMSTFLPPHTSNLKMEAAWSSKHWYPTTTLHSITTQETTNSTLFHMLWQLENKQCQLNY